MDYFDYYNFGQFEIINSNKSDLYERGLSFLNKQNFERFSDIEPYANWTAGDRWYWIFRASKNNEQSKFYIFDHFNWFAKPVEIGLDTNDILVAPVEKDNYLHFDYNSLEEYMLKYEDQIELFVDPNFFERSELLDFFKKHNFEHPEQSYGAIEVLLVEFIRSNPEYQFFQISDYKFGLIKGNMESIKDLFRKGFLQGCYNTAPTELYD